MNDRISEETRSELDISVYDTERNEKAKQHRVERVSLTISSLFSHKCIQFRFEAHTISFFSFRFVSVILFHVMGIQDYFDQSKIEF